MLVLREVVMAAAVVVLIMVVVMVIVVVEAVVVVHFLQHLLKISTPCRRHNREKTAPFSGKYRREVQHGVIVTFWVVATPATPCLPCASLAGWPQTRETITHNAFLFFPGKRSEAEA